MNNLGFWGKLKKPFSVSAPLAGVSDFAFRSMLVKYGKPDVIYTEMLTTEGLAAKGEKEFALQMQYSETERPIVAQIFGSCPKKVERAARIVKERGFDGVDINMGCPQDIITRQGAGAALIKCPSLACEIIEAAKMGAGDLPVSVKTRTGWKDHKEAEDWIKVVASSLPATITLHGRTREMKGGGVASWEVIKEAVNVIRNINPSILIVGNGDVLNREDGLLKTKIAGTDGYMIGRGAIGNPWTFENKLPSVYERLQTLLEHTDIFVMTFGEQGFARIRMHYSEYLSQFPGSKELREKIMVTKSLLEVKDIINPLLENINEK